MSTHLRAFLALLLTMTLSLMFVVSCGDDDEPTASLDPTGGEVTIPTAEELDAAVLTLDDLGEGWTDYRHGVLTAEDREMMPTLDLCPEAGEQAVQAVAGLVWQAYAHANHPLDDPTAYPLNVQQYLVAADLDEAESVFAALRDGSEICFEQGPTVTEDGETLTATPMALPELGDESFGYEVVVAEPTGMQWDIREVIVRKEATLMWLQELEIVEGDNVLTIDDIGDLATEAVDRLP